MSFITLMCVSEILYIPAILVHFKALFQKLVFEDNCLIILKTRTLPSRGTAAPGGPPTPGGQSAPGGPFATRGPPAPRAPPAPGGPPAPRGPFPSPAPGVQIQGLPTGVREDVGVTPN